jgi:cyclase
MKNLLAPALLAAATVVFTVPAWAQQAVDFSKVEIKTIDLGNKTYRLEGQGGNITIAVGSDGIIMVDSQFAPLHDKIKAAIAAISPLPIKYLINTHFHGDHTGGNELFQNAGTTNGISGAKTPPMPPGALPKQTYIGGTMTLTVGGRTAQLTHVNNAHTDGDTWVYFADANVLCTGDTMNNTKRYQTIDFANGGDIRGMIRATDTYLTVANDDTKVMTGHGTLAKKADIAEFNAMLKTARDRIEKLFKEGQSEADVVAARPLKDLDKTWAANDEAAVNFVKMVYNSFKRS